jgi:UDP-glucose 4-epimerase
MPKILITGGVGFIGSSLVNALMHLGGYHIIVLDNLSKCMIDNISNWSESSNIEFKCTDMLDLSLVQREVDTCDIVFHLAGNVIVSLPGNDTKTDYEQNLLATYNILEAMKNSQRCKNLIYASTSASYGEAKNMPTSELYSPLKPISLYGATKLACEAMICGYCHMFDISCAVARLANITGPLSRHGVLYDFIKKISSHPNFLNILGNGKQRKSYLYIDDCVNALLVLLGIVKNLTFEVFNVGSDDTITVLEIAEILVQELSLSKVNITYTDTFNGRGWKGDIKESWLDCSKLKALGWKAKYNSREAIICTIRQLLTE